MSYVRAHRLPRPLATQVYQLRHVETGSWLCVESIGALEHNHKLQVVLVNREHNSRHCLFRRVPCKYRTHHPHRTHIAHVPHARANLANVVTAKLLQSVMQYA